MEHQSLVSQRKFGRLGVTGVFAVAALFLILVAGWLVDRRSATAADRKLITVIRKSADRPVAPRRPYLSRSELNLRCNRLSVLNIGASQLQDPRPAGPSYVCW